MKNFQRKADALDALGFVEHEKLAVRHETAQIFQPGFTQKFLDLRQVAGNVGGLLGACLEDGFDQRGFADLPRAKEDDDLAFEQGRFDLPLYLSLDQHGAAKAKAELTKILPADQQNFISIQKALAFGGLSSRRKQLFHLHLHRFVHCGVDHRFCPPGSRNNESQVFAQRENLAQRGGPRRMPEVNSVQAPVRIVADDRENAGGVIAELRARADVALEVRRLATGDFLVEDKFAVERKTLADFARSVVDARLFKQAAALARRTWRGVLVLEGTAVDLGDNGVRREALQGALITVSVFYGLAVLRARDAAETARLLVYLGRQARQFAHDGLTRPGYRPKGKRARQLFVLQGLPGVGPERAARLLERFGSVQAVAVASAAALAAVDGIGETTATRIRWAVEEAPGSYEV
jgi:DNA excision repair protein ERCC-4